MKNLICLLLMLTAWSANAQEKYAKVYKYGQYQPNWAKVKTIAGTYGFIDREGNEVVPAIYGKVQKFGDGGLVLVRSIADTYGLVNAKGTLIAPAIYEKIEVPANHVQGIAILRTINGSVKMIDKEGNEVIPAAAK